MRVLSLSGSRNRQGQTARSMDAVRRGVVEAGGQYESVFLTECTIERCRQCNDDGWGLCLSEERCIIEDDFTSLVEKIRVSDIVVFATPVYFHDLSESMKTFLDRLRRIGFMKILRAPISAGPGPMPAEGGIPAIGICYAGGSGNGTVLCCTHLERVLQICGFDVVDMIPVRRQNIEMKLPMLEHVGRWLVTKPTSGPSVTPPR
jgi:NAD(P)H-dependent FMN reductase